MKCCWLTTGVFAGSPALPVQSVHAEQRRMRPVVPSGHQRDGRVQVRREQQTGQRQPHVRPAQLHVRRQQVLLRQRQVHLQTVGLRRR